eukprot:CAMPEP_0172631028 /NCGR_PEP_ID=MMETSP1068-20121228/176858_2 /TAXON_ID=35684 /ORGANISM="Pseudopedinella elastica, Strain CCMP716" /LENGTH=62 /DNA_ID=CAMNT_0013442037 /DNA_START=57 /DNA_END=241 /DNA_ORIENTATION=-
MRMAVCTSALPSREGAACTSDSSFSNKLVASAKVFFVAPRRARASPTIVCALDNSEAYPSIS